MAAPHLGVAVSQAVEPAKEWASAAERGGPCRTCRFFGGYSRSGAQSWCLRELPMKVLWMEPGKGCGAHVVRERLAA